jgi:hypothetical protein
MTSNRNSNKINCPITYILRQGLTKFPNICGHLKIIVTRRLTWSNFHIDGPHKLGATIQNSDATATWRPRSASPCVRLYYLSEMF